MLARKPRPEIHAVLPSQSSFDRRGRVDARCPLVKGARRRGGFGIGAGEASEIAHYLLPEPVDLAIADHRYQRYFAGLARFEAHGRTGRDVEAHAARLLALEGEAGIGLVEMVMRADLDRAIALVGDRERHHLAPGIELDGAFRRGNLARAQ